METFSLSGFARFVTTELIVNASEGRKQALEVMARAIKGKARAVLGTYEYGWPPLQPETVAQKSRGDSPLLETGELRDSIGYTIIEPGKRAEVGSDLDIAVYQELGAETIPARSFLAQTGARHGKAAAELAGAIVAAAIADKRALGGELRELFHALDKLGHNLKEDAKELLDGADENEKQK